MGLTPLSPLCIPKTMDTTELEEDEITEKALWFRQEGDTFIITCGIQGEDELRFSKQAFHRHFKVLE